MSTSAILLQDIFEVKDIDPSLGEITKTKKFDKVSRLVCTSEHFDLNMILDINCDIYQVDIGDKLTYALAKTLDLKGGQDEGVYDPLLGTEEKPSLMDKYDYVMYGKVFKFKSEGTKVSIYVSFGGLLMKLSGDARNLKIEPDTSLYLLIRKSPLKE